MTILITGAAGFIGSHVVDHFLSQGHTVVGIDNFDPFYSRRHKEMNIASALKSDSFHFYEMDICDRDAIDRLFSAHEMDMVIHLAAKAGVRPSIDAVGDYYQVNVNGTVNILETMKKYGVSNMVFASSSSVYGNNPKVPFSEEDKVDHPISPYASTKKSAELLCHVYAHLFNFNITCLRFFTVYGPRQRPDLAIHKFTGLILDEKPIPVYGDGSTARDYTYVDDIVNGISCAALNLNGYRLFNLGESRVISLMELIRTIEGKCGKKAILKQLPLQPGDVAITYADVTKARTEIGYNPRFDFETGIGNFVEWLVTFREEMNTKQQRAAEVTRS